MEAAMIHVITASNRHLYRVQLVEMHQLRRVHFVEECGWKGLKVIDGGEYDQFDDERTVYILALGPRAEVLAGMRARPTDDMSMLVDVFPALIGPDQPPVHGPGVWEIGRSFTTTAARAMAKASGAQFSVRLLLAAMEWLQANGVERLIGIAELPMFAMCRRWGWNVRMTGLPLETPEGPIVGVEAANTEADIESFRRLNRIYGRVAQVVTDADIAAFGGLEQIEAEFAVFRADRRLAAREIARPSGRSA
jgi:N-acyl-L-homoserine lactone synthetase